MTIYAVNGKEPVAAWIESLDPEATSSTVATDLISGNNGTLTNMVPASDRVSDTGAGGVRALDFDGVDDAVSCGAILDSVFAGAGKKFTLTSWIYPRVGAGANDVILAKLDATTYNQRQFMMRNLGGYLDFVWYGALNSSSYRGYTCDDPLTLDAWQHVAVVYDATQSLGSRVKMYVNGVLQSQTITNTLGTPSQIQSSTAYLYFGNANRGNLSIFSFDGRLDDGRIFDTNLDASDLTYLSTRRGIVGGGIYRQQRSQQIIN